MKREPAGFVDSVGFYASFFTKYGLRTLWALFFKVLATLPVIVVPLFIKVIIDHYIPAADKVSVIVMLGVMVFLLCLNVLFHTAYWVNFTKVVKSVSRDMRHTIVSRLQILSLAYYHKRETGRYYSKIIVDVDRAEQFANVFGNNIFSAALILSVLTMVLGYVNFRILMTFMLVFPVFYLLVAVFKNRAVKVRYFERMARENLSATVSNFLQTSMLARMHGHEHFERRKVDATGSEVVEKTTEAEANIALFGSLNTMISMSFHFVVITIASINVINGELTIGEMLLFVQYIGQMMNQFVQIINSLPVISRFTEAVASIKEILEAPDVEYNHGKRKLSSIRGDVRLEDVSFAYEEGPVVLGDVNVDIPHGTSVGLVGKSGSGKSTFMNLILGLYRTQNGAIYIDDIPVSELDMRSVRRSIGVVSQDPILFTGTVYDNITHAYTKTPLERVIEVAKKANAHEFIGKMKKGYDTEVGENGVLLSGGQKQRIALARTILRDPSILVLDEATSALDSESEREVQEAIDNLSDEMTTFIIAHRLSTIRNVDLILVFKDGKIVERGTHEELVAMNGEYSTLLAYQSLGENPPADETKKCKVA